MDKETVNFILNVLRRESTKWSGRRNCLKKSRKKVQEKCPKTEKIKTKLYWQCAICLCWERDVANMEVDHILEIGQFSGDLFKQIEVMFDEENLQALCISCHAKKTATFNSSLIFKRKFVREMD